MSTACLGPVDFENFQERLRLRTAACLWLPVSWVGAWSQGGASDVHQINADSDLAHVGVGSTEE